MVMLHGCALLLFLESVQGTRSELAGHDSANQESCRANKISEKHINWSGKSNPKCKMDEQKRSWGDGSLLHLHIFNCKEKCEKAGNKTKQNRNNPTASQVKDEL